MGLGHDHFRHKSTRLLEITSEVRKKKIKDLMSTISYEKIGVYQYSF